MLHFIITYDTKQYGVPILLARQCICNLIVWLILTSYLRHSTLIFLKSFSLDKMNGSNHGNDVRSKAFRMVKVGLIRKETADGFSKGYSVFEERRVAKVSGEFLV